MRWIGLMIACLGWAFAQPRVVVSLEPYASLVTQVAGDRAEVTRLLPPGASPHTFDPAPRDAARIAEADLVVLNGGLDEWLADLVPAGGASVLRALDVVTFDPLAADAAEAGGGVNPHIWLDPTLMAAFVPKLVEVLSLLDTTGAERYRAQGDALVASLHDLDITIAARLEPVRGAPFVPFHDAWPYFARHYGLDLVLSLEPAPGREPSARFVSEALAKISASGAKAVFSEVQLPARPAEVVAANAGVALYLLDPLGGSADVPSYQAMLLKNAQTIADALK